MTISQTYKRNKKVYEAIHFVWYTNIERSIRKTVKLTVYDRGK